MGQWKGLYVGFIFTVHVCVLSRFSRVRLFVTLWTVAHQAPLSLGFSRQEYWSGLPCPSPGDLPDPRIEPTSLMSPALASRFFNTSATWEAPSLFVGIEFYSERDGKPLKALRKGEGEGQGWKERA